MNIELILCVHTHDMIFYILNLNLWTVGIKSVSYSGVTQFDVNATKE